MSVVNPFKALSDAQAMSEALQEAHKAGQRGEVPIGCVIVNDAGIVASGFNLRESQTDPTAHAEMIAIREASRQLGRWRLSDCTLYVTLEPCFMCAGAIVLARIPRVVFGALDPKAGASGSLANILQDTRLNHRCQLTPGVLGEQCGQVLKDFFKLRRQSKSVIP